jgi:hypothetical protein
MDDDFTITLELSLFISNIKKEVCGVLDSFLSFLKNYEKKETHNMFSLMLDPQFKNLHLLVMNTAILLWKSMIGNPCNLCF